MGENAWTHLGIVLVPALMIVAMWLDTRRARRDEERHSADRHIENVSRLTSIETKIEPIYHWWNRTRGGSS